MAATNRSLFIPKIRENTHTKTTQPENKSLAKSANRYHPTKGAKYGGDAGSIGVFYTINKQGLPKTVYQAQHEWMEYIYFEVLCLLHLYTPKARLILNKNQNDIITSSIVVTNEIKGYVPMTALFDLKFFRSKPIPQELIAFNEQFRLDMERQLIVNKKTGECHKISGNLFASALGGLLIQDDDFQPIGLNRGVFRHGKRFFGALIDKDLAIITGRVFERIVTPLNQLSQDALFLHANKEQKLSIIHHLAEALIAQADGESALEKVFKNKRIQATFPKDYLNQIMRDEKLLEKTAVSFVEAYLKEDSGALIKFKQREAIRYQIAEIVLAKIDFLTPEDREALKAIIVEDLRAPYYQDLLLNKNPGLIQEEDIKNEALINAILKDQLDELKVLCEATQQASAIAEEKHTQETAERQSREKTMN